MGMIHSNTIGHKQKPTSFLMPQYHILTAKSDVMRPRMGSPLKQNLPMMEHGMDTQYHGKLYLTPLLINGSTMAL